MPACLPASCYGGHRELRGPQGVLRLGRGGAGPGATGHPGERSPVGARSERGRGRAGVEGVRGCGGRAELRGGAQRERVCAPRSWSTAYSRGEHLSLRPVDGEGEVRKVLRVPVQGTATFRLRHCGRNIGERERW